MYKQTFKKFSLLWSLLCLAIVLQAQIPAGYYDGAKGAKGSNLKTALFKIVSGHKALSYDDLWNAYKTTDVRSDGKIWDMYSSKTNYSVNDHGGGYRKEGDMFNREHSFPKSWFNDAKPMYTDLFHLYPTDGYVNGRRSNYPYGENNGELYSSANGFSKLGKCTTEGYSGTVFEPNDEYKGDLARTYFYMATAYEDRISSWSSPMLSGDAYPAYAKWVVNMLLRWAKEDPVSQKEFDRNNAVYKIQHNRNPFIDYPGLEQYVWGAQTSTAFDPDNYEGGTGGGGVTPPNPPVPSVVVAPTFSPVAGVVTKGSTVTISTPTKGATIYYTVNAGELKTAHEKAEVVINENTTIKAYSMLGENKSNEVVATYTVVTQPTEGENVYVLTTDASSLAAGTKFLIVCTSQQKALSAAATKGKFRQPASVSIAADHSIATTIVNSDSHELYPVELTLVGTSDAWSILDAATHTYLAIEKNANALSSIANNTNLNAQWTISISDKEATITNCEYTARSIRYNKEQPRFSTYTANQQPVQIYVSAASTSLLQPATSVQQHVIVYDLNGQFVRVASSINDAFTGLPAGLYIVNGKKVLVR